jgi:predicted Rossmann fold nucleotide-binding protein DprA/Smf involved in DNA uptake
VLPKTASPDSNATTPAPSAITTGSTNCHLMSADQKQPDDFRRYLAAIQAQPRTAAELASIVHKPINQVLWELRMYERYGRVKPRTDARGVQFWVPMPEHGKKVL